MTDTPESVRKIAACVPFIDTNGGVNETQEALERYADLLERISKAPVARIDYTYQENGLVKAILYGLTKPIPAEKRVAMLQVEE